MENASGKSRWDYNCRIALQALLAVVVVLFGGCATFRNLDPMDVTLAGVESLKGEGLELRMLVKLRVQNPNNIPLKVNGVSVRMDVQGRRFATGVSDVSVSIPRFGETVVEVPVSISVLRIAQQAIDIANDKYHGKLPYKITGKLAGPAFSSVRFTSKGEFTLPKEFYDRDQ